jgi:hypothetical protein
MRTLWHLTITACFILSIGSAAWAESPDKERASVVFKQGVEHYEAGRHAKALEAFEEVDRLRPTWKIYFNIGQCRAILKHYGRAIEAFERYLAKGGDDVPSARRDEVLGELRRLREMVGVLDVKAPNGAVVIVDGEERGRAPLPGRLRLVAGVNHTVVVKKGDDVLLDRTVRVGGGESIVIEAEAIQKSSVEKEPEAPAVETQSEPTAAPAPDERPRILPVLVGISAGLAVVAGGMGTGFWVAAGKRDDEFQDRNKMLEDGLIPADDDKLLEARDDTERYDNLATGMLVTAGVFAASAAVILIVHLAKKDDEDPQVAVLPGQIAVRF